MLVRISTSAAAVALGEALGALATVAATALVARALEPEGFGYFVLVLAYASALELLFTFQSSRVFVRYAAAAEAAGNRTDLGLMLRYCQLLDVTGMAVALAVGLSFAPFVTGRIGLDSQAPVILYCIVLLFGVTGHAQGVLRHFARFAFIGFHGALSGLLRLAAIGVAVWSGRDSLTEVVVAFLVADALARMVLVFRGWLESRRQCLAPPWRLRFQDLRQRYPDVINFALLSNLSDTVLKVAQQADVFVIAAILAPAEAGFYRLIKVLGSVLTMAGSAVGQVIYPQIAKLHLTDPTALRAFLRNLWKLLAVGALTGFVVYALIGEAVIHAIFGPDFLPAYRPSLIFMAGAALSLLCLPITPLLLVRGQQGALLMAYSVASASYLAVLAAGATSQGLVGAAFAFPGLYVAYILITATILSRGHAHK